MTDRNRPRRPASLDGKAAELIWGDSDPALTSEAAHATANAVVLGPTRLSDDTELAARVGAIIDTEGLDEIAALWSRSPATTLPGALWRLYLLRAWLQRDPETIANRFREGVATAGPVPAGTRPDPEVESGEATGTPDAGQLVAPAPQPSEIEEQLAALFKGTTEQDLDEILDSGAAFLCALADGAAAQTGWITHDEEAARPVTGRIRALTTTADELSHAAVLARSRRLD